MSYLLIQNPGVAPIESFTLLGASGSRGLDAANGKFGSGNKLGITALLRAGLGVTVYCGKDRLVFGTRKAEFEGEPVERVTVAINGKKAADLGWVLSWGSNDWTNVGMGLRELIANALDASIKGRGYKADLETGDLSIDIQESKRAKFGFTRVYIEVSPAVTKYLSELSKRFLHFSDTPLDQEILPKAGRSLSGSGKAMVYRMGIFVCELDGDSLYDYNFGPNDIEIDECRNSNEYSVRGTIAKRLRRATATELTPVFEAVGKGQVTMESKLDPYYLCPSWDTPKAGEIAEWQAAWKQAHGDAILTDKDSRNLEYVQRKGYAAKQVDSAGWRESLQKFGIKAAEDVLSAGEMVGRVPTGVDQSTFQVFHNLWNTVVANGRNADKKQPVVGCFREENGHTKFYVEGDTIFIREGLDSLDTCRAILEGIAEYVTGYGSLTGKFQDWAFDLLVEVI